MTPCGWPWIAVALLGGLAAGALWGLWRFMVRPMLEVFTTHGDPDKR